MKKFWLWMIVLIMLFAAACSSKDEKPSVTEETQASTETTYETVETETTVVTEMTEETTVATEPIWPTEVQEELILENLKPYYEKNHDLVGWIRVPDTKIDNPVMQTSLDNRNYYLDKDFEHKYNKAGTLYIREQCDVFWPSDNLVIYGHNMANNTMFGILDKYRKQDYWQNNQYIYFDTLYEQHKYQIFAVFKTSANEGEGYPYHRFNDAASAEEYDAFISTIKSMAFYDTGITPQYGDELITLSTCEYTLNNGRLVVVAYLVE
ncbi:MAG: class B sortase [Oscillospiraceae bacterium]|nr:class B sortase [Oscillospiraceae bacterium]